MLLMKVLLSTLSSAEVPVFESFQKMAPPKLEFVPPAPRVWPAWLPLNRVPETSSVFALALAPGTAIAPPRAAAVVVVVAAVFCANSELVMEPPEPDKKRTAPPLAVLLVEIARF